MMPGRRNERLAEEIREEVAQILAGDMKNPKLGFVTVTRVQLTADLRTARVLVSAMGDPAQKKQSLRVLHQAAGWVRRELGRRLSVRHTPEVMFVHDEGLDHTDRVARLLEETQAAKPEVEPEPEDE
jgi:ribosome-binding factor A